MPAAPSDNGHIPSALRKAVAAIPQAFRNVGQTLSISLNPSEETAWLAEAQHRLQRNSSRSSMMTMPVAGLLVTLAFRPWVSLEWRMAWWLLLTLVCMGVHVGSRWIDRMTARDAATISRKSKYATLFSSAYFLTWCSMSVFLWSPGDPMDHMLLVLILACSMAGTIVLSAAHPPIAVAALLIHAIFLVGPPALGHSALDVELSLLSAIFTVLLIGQLAVQTNGVNRLLTLEHERAGLVQNLRAAKRESDMERGRAAQAGRAKSQFLSHMNHELRTPMNAILGFSEIIQAKSFGSDVDKYAEYAAIIHESGEHLLSLIDGMIDMAKIDAGKLSLREDNVDMAWIIADAMAREEQTARQARIALVSKVSRGLPRVFADERGLRQIIANLLSNALKFTQAEGSVTLFARVEEDGGMAFGVADTGIGIANEDKDKVFERFGHGRHDVTEDLKGTGLGLAIVKGFAEAHDGSVELESALGSGTCVTVTLPKDRVLAPENRRLAG
ncbi:MAG: HAMP domain-containing histidine kinase [Proteobacteria bacterium]|nr:HAMP domain-containing histidine kinase [Pseudomonadota bacterium]